MGKNNKKTAPVAAPKTEVSTTKNLSNEELLQQAGKATTMGSTSMDRNHQVDLMKMMHETFRMDPDAAKHTGFSPDSVNRINQLTAMGMVTIYATEVAFGNSDFAIRLRTADLPAFKEMAAQIGVKIDETKFLPSPENSEVSVAESAKEAIEVSEETKEELKKDADIQKKNAGKTFDVANMDDTGLKDALEYFMTTHQGEMIMENLNKAVNIYRAYNKKKNPDQAKHFDDMPTSDVFQEILNLTGRVGILASGIGQYAYMVTAQTGSPAAAFCSLRNASIARDTKEQKFTDIEIADMTRMLVIARANFVISENQKNLDSFKAAKKPDEDKIKIIEANIKRAQSVIDLVNNPSADYTNKFAEAYKSDDQKTRMLTHKTLKSVINCYKPEISNEKLGIAKVDSLLATTTQYLGYITNLFRTPDNQLSGYGLDSIPEILFKSDEELAEEKKAAEEDAKKAAEQKAKEDAKKAAIGKAKSQGKK